MIIQDDTWWVIGCPERGAYMHWKGDHRSGTYADTGSIDAAERFESKDIANDRRATDPDAIRYLENRDGLGFRVCVVKRKTHVI